MRRRGRRVAGRRRPSDPYYPGQRGWHLTEAGAWERGPEVPSRELLWAALGFLVVVGGTFVTASLVFVGGILAGFLLGTFAIPVWWMFWPRSPGGRVRIWCRAYDSETGRRCRNRPAPGRKGLCYRHSVDLRTLPVSNQVIR